MPRGTTPKERKEKITKKEESDNLLKEISNASNQLKETRLRKLLLKFKNKKDNNPGAAQSTKALEKESKKKKVKESLRDYAGGMLGTVPMIKGSNPIKRPKINPPVKSAEGPKKPTLRERFSESPQQANKKPVEKKKGGEVKKKSKKSGRLALRGYGKSR